MKKMGKLLFTFVVFILLMSGVKAETYFNVTKAVNGSGNACPKDSVVLKHVGYDETTGQGIHFYNVYVGGSVFGQTFCMAPGKTSYQNGNHTCQRMVMPQKKGSNQAFDVAATYAYQTMIDEGIIGKDPTTRSRLIGTIVFRWLEYYFGQLDRNGSSYKIAPYIFTSGTDNRKKSSYWNQSNSYVQKAIEISTEAKKIGEKISKGKTTYEALVANGTIWTDEWDFALVNTVQEGNYVTIKFDVTPKVDKAPKYVKWSKFDITCEYGYQCKVISKKKISENKGRYVVKINTQNGDINKTGNQTYGMKITTAYIDQKNPAAYLMFIRPDAGMQYYQKMLVVKDYVSSYIIQTEIPVNLPETKCLCEEVNGKYTGNYINYVTDEFGNTTIEKIDKNDSRVASLGCPDKCENNNKPSCEIDTSGGKTVYHCKDGEKCTQKEYHKQCLHVCETPDQNDEHKYYCQEKLPDKGGEECDESQYLDECYCPPLKETCENNPDDPACDEYKEKCPNCNASVSVPGSCNDFNTNSTVTGSISDINQQKSECNESVNPVKRCVIDSVDQTNTSYEATNEIANNKYCKVWCDEQYTFDVPTARYSLSGGYFNLSAKISGTRNCYVSAANNPDKPINVEKFEKDLKGLNSNLYEMWNEWNKWNTLYESAEAKKIADTDTTDKAYEWSYQVYNASNNKVSTEKASATISKANMTAFKNKYYNEYQSINKEISDATNAFNACTTTWKNNMNFDPEIDFTYHEEEYSKISDGKFKRVSEVETSINDIYCLGDTDDQYNCLSNKILSSDGSVPNSVFKNTTVVTCNNNGCTANKKFKISQAKWIQKSKTKTASYSPSQNFSTYHQYGTVKTGTVCENANISGYNNCLWTRLPDTSLPVELKTGKGAFPFTLKFSNIGQSNQNNTLGRLVGKDSQVSVLTEYNNLPEEKKCSANGKQNGTLTQDVGYVCAYVNNCPECDVSCDGDNCYIKEQCDGECPVSCKNCIFNGNTTAFKYRTISLNNLFPNSCDSNTTDCRKEGYNWNTTKAEVTEAEIESLGDSIYNTPEYSYTINATQMNEIRKYNNSVGSYANTSMPNGENALQCEQITDNNTGLQYSVNCISTFLNDQSNKYFTTNSRNTEFTLWQNSQYCITNNNCVLSREDGIGPSWK